MGELLRIRDLPVHLDVSVEVEAVSAEHRRSGATGVFRPSQVRCLVQLAMVSGLPNRGLLGVLGVGEGKTLVSFLAPRQLGARRAIILVPSAVLPQTLRMFSQALQEWDLGDAAIRICTYSELSLPSGTGLLEAYKPDVIVADECHKLKHCDSARTRRFLRYMHEHPDCRFVGLSGTITQSSLSDYGHLAECALREGSPLPRDRGLLEAWARVIDPDGVPANSDWAKVRYLCEEAVDTGLPVRARRAQVQAAYRDRFLKTSGVVVTAGERLGTSLRFVPVIVPFPPALEDAYAEADQNMRPDGEFTESDAESWRLRRQISLGFWYRWDWGPDGRDEEWLTARRSWIGVARSLALELGTGLDSPALVEVALREGRLNVSWAKEALDRWDVVRGRYRPEPPVVPEWLGRSALLDLVDLFPSGSAGIVWYESTAVGDALEQHGRSVKRAGEEPRLDGQGIQCLQIDSHGQGWNLQAYSRNLVLEPPSGGGRWEQLVGRTHRQGQKADEVVVYYAAHTPVFRASVEAAKKDAEYVERTTGQAQRLRYGDWCTAEGEA